MVLAGSIGDDFLGRDKNAWSHKYISSHEETQQIMERDEAQRK